jgi:RNA recognition motif-containing protein
LSPDLNQEERIGLPIGKKTIEKKKKKIGFCSSSSRLRVRKTSSAFFFFFFFFFFLIFLMSGSQPERPRGNPGTRLIVKNLPAHVNEKRLLEHFATRGAVTDARVLRTRDGFSRKIGFVGFRTAQECGDALRYFNNTFLDTSRLAVERALAVGDKKLPRAWSRHTKARDAELRDKYGAPKEDETDGKQAGSKGYDGIRKKKKKKKKKKTGAIKPPAPQP